MKKMNIYKTNVFIIVLTFLLFLSVTGSAYAWQRLTDERVNSMQVGRLELALEGNQAIDILNPAHQSKKQLAIRNQANMRTLVRVSLTEVLLTFQLDLADKTGNAQLLTVPQPTATIIDQKDSATWLAQQTFQQPDGTWLKSQECVRAAITLDQQAATRPPILTDSIRIQWGNQLTTSWPPLDEEQPYWLYENGYFYYSKVLAEGESTAVLVASIEASATMPNEAKGAFYEIKGRAEGLAASKQSLTEAGGWQLDRQSLVYKMLESKVD